MGPCSVSSFASALVHGLARVILDFLNPDRDLCVPRSGTGTAGRQSAVAVASRPSLTQVRHRPAAPEQRRVRNLGTHLTARAHVGSAPRRHHGQGAFQRDDRVRQRDRSRECVALFRPRCTRARPTHRRQLADPLAPDAVAASKAHSRGVVPPARSRRGVSAVARERIARVPGRQRARL